MGGQAMKIILEKNEALQYLHDALCNGLGYIYQYGVEVSNDQVDYDKAKEWLKANKGTCMWDASDCYEDILMAMVMTCGLRFEDRECGVDAEQIHVDTLVERMQLVPAKWILQMADENDDAETGDVIIQCLLFGEIVFG